MVFVYGLACGMNHWNHQIQYFSKNYQVITYDLRGHQRSLEGVEKENLNIEWMTKDLIQLMEVLKLKSTTAIGHSYGVPLIIRAAQNRPDLIEHMVFINGFARSPLKKMFGTDAVENFFNFVKSTYHQAPSVFDGLWKNIVLNPATAYLTALAGGFNIKLTAFKDIEIYSRGVAQMRLEHFMPLFEELFELNEVSRLPELKQETLVIEGENDLVTPGKHQLDFVENIKNVQHTVVPYGSHCTQLDFPDYVNLRLEKFLQETSSAH